MTTTATTLAKLQYAMYISGHCLLCCKRGGKRPSIQSSTFINLCSALGLTLVGICNSALSISLDNVETLAIDEDPSIMRGRFCEECAPIVKDASKCYLELKAGAEVDSESKDGGLVLVLELEKTRMSFQLVLKSLYRQIVGSDYRLGKGWSEIEEEVQNKNNGCFLNAFVDKLRKTMATACARRIARGEQDAAGPRPGPSNESVAVAVPTTSSPATVEATEKVDAPGRHITPDVSPDGGDDEIDGVVTRAMTTLQVIEDVLKDPHFQPFILVRKLTMEMVEEEKAKLKKKSKRSKSNRKGKRKTKASIIKIRLSSGKTEYRCSKCGKEYVRNGSARKHVVVHSSEPEPQRTPREYQCQQCPRRFVFSSGLDCHIARLHPKVIGHPCSWCDKQLSSSSALRRHMEIHAGIRNHKCGICSMQFNNSVTLKRHFKRHSWKKPEVCCECAMGFATNAELPPHRKSHAGAHRKKIFKCRHCHFWTNYRPGLRMHLRAMH